AGERCMAAAVVAVEEEVADKFIQELNRKSNEQKIGDGRDEGVFLGPVIRDSHKEKTLGYIETGEKEGATLVRDGREDKVEEDGYFVGPTIFDNVSTDMTIWKDEIRSEERRVGREGGDRGGR